MTGLQRAFGVKGLVAAINFTHVYRSCRFPARNGTTRGGSGVAKIQLGKRNVSLPENRLLRIAIGGTLVVGGLFGFLPILGFWMLPLGFLVLATDIPAVRRMNRRTSVAVKRWWTGARRGPKSQAP